MSREDFKKHFICEIWCKGGQKICYGLGRRFFTWLVLSPLLSAPGKQIRVSVKHMGVS